MWAKKGQSGGKNLKILFLGVILAFIELDESLHCLLFMQVYKYINMWFITRKVFYGAAKNAGLYLHTLYATYS